MFSLARGYQVMHGFIETEMGDIKLSQWLRARGWQGNYHGYGGAVPCTFFPNGAGLVLAVVFYRDNCERDVWLNSTACLIKESGKC
jgi:hypothetical protein